MTELGTVLDGKYEILKKLVRVECQLFIWRWIID